jgi:hypothetical protein
VATAEPAESPTTNKLAPVVDDLADAVARYVGDLQRAPLATRTREAYASRCAADHGAADELRDLFERYPSL